MMNWMAAALIILTAAALLKSIFARDERRGGAAIVIACGENAEGIAEQVCAYHNDEQAGGGLYRRRIILVSPDGKFCAEAEELAERFEEVSLASAGELAELIKQGRL